jgi:hypothetical protein
MGAVNGHLKSGKKIFENNKKQFLLGLEKKPKNYSKNNSKLLLKNKVIGNKSVKKFGESKKHNEKPIKIDKNVNIKIKNNNVLKESSIKIKKGTKSKSTVRNVIISEDKKIEKSRAKVLHSLIHVITVAKNLKRIILAKVGFSDFSSVLLINIFNKKKQLNKDKTIVDNKDIKEVKIIDDINVKEKNISENYSGDMEDLVPESSYFKIPKVPDLITSLENNSKINISVDNFQPLIPEINMQNSENLGDIKKICENENIKIDRNIMVNLSLNNLSKSCIDNLVDMINSI